MRPPTGNIITQAQHLVSKSVDYSYYRNTGDATIYAPESGVIDSYQQRGVGKEDGGNCLRLKGATGLHQFAHCERSLVKVGQKVVKGQPLAIMGSTGYVKGRHLHYWVLTPSGYKYPPTLYTEPFGGRMEDMVTLDIGRILLFSIQGKNGLYDDKNALNGSMDKEINKYLVGKPTNQIIMELINDKTSIDYRENYQIKANNALKAQSAKPKELKSGLYQVV